MMPPLLHVFNGLASSVASRLLNLFHVSATYVVNALRTISMAGKSYRVVMNELMNENVYVGLLLSVKISFEIHLYCIGPYRNEKNCFKIRNDFIMYN